MRGCLARSYFSSLTGRSPRTNRIASALSTIRTSSGVRSSRPESCQLVDQLPLRPVERVLDVVSMVSLPSSSLTYLWVDCSLPPR